jgi:hypothetical protein
MIIEVFIRKNFGERYFKIASAYTIAVILALYPFFNPYRMIYGENKFNLTVKENLLWFLFIPVFLFFAHKRNKEVNHSPYFIDYERFSYCYGDIHPLFWEIRIPGIRTFMKNIEIYFEPMVALVPGIILMLFGDNLGYLLTFCAIMYSLSYKASYWMGDQYIMDMMDKMLINEAMQVVLHPETEVKDFKGFRHRGRIPNDEYALKKIKEQFRDEEEVAEAR